MHTKRTPTVVIIIIVILVLAAAVLGALFLANRAGENDGNLNPFSQNNGESTQNGDSANPYIISYTGEAGKTVLEQLQSRADVALDDAGLGGAYVNEINGLKNGDDNRYWSYYVNGERATTPEEDFVTNNNEQIKWKFQELE